jgi:hypothetical protein
MVKKSQPAKEKPAVSAAGVARLVALLLAILATGVLFAWWMGQADRAMRATCFSSAAGGQAITLRA